MLKEAKPESNLPTPSFFQHFETPSNKHKTQTPRYRSRINSKLDTNLVPILDQALVQNVLVNTLPVISLHTMVALTKL